MSKSEDYRVNHMRLHREVETLKAEKALYKAALRDAVNTLERASEMQQGHNNMCQGKAYELRKIDEGEETTEASIRKTIQEADDLVAEMEKKYDFKIAGEE